MEEYISKSKMKFNHSPDGENVDQFNVTFYPVSQITPVYPISEST